VYDRVILTAIAARKRQKRGAAAAASVDAAQFTEMEKQVVALRTLHIDTLLLFECGYRMRLFAEDAEHAAAVLGIRAQRHRAFLEASIPVHRTLFHARRLVNAGFKVGVVKQVDSAAMRTVSESRSAHRKPLQRYGTARWTRWRSMHSKPFFTQALYNVGDETKRSQTTKHGVGSLFSILNHTKTDFGARRLREWIRCPLGSLSEITERQQTIQSLAFPSGTLSKLSVPHIMVYEELTTTILPRCKPLLRCLQQIHLGKATPSQTVNALQMLQELEVSLNELKGLFTVKRSQATQLERILGGFPTMSVVLLGHLGEIDVKSAKRNDMELAILKRLQQQRSQADKYREFTTRLESLAEEYDSVLQSCRRILQNSSLGYTTFRGGAVSDIRHLIQVNREDLHVAPKDWLVVNSTKKLLRFHPKEIVQLHVQEEVAKQQKQQLIQSVWRQFVSQVDAQIYVMGMNCVDLLATLDALCSLATVAQSYPNYTMPEFVNGESSLLEIVDGRHPIIEALLEQSSYISNSVFLTSNATSPGSLLVVSGPNMGGKTSLLRMCALIVLLAQMGSFVPATSVRLTAFDGVYTLMHRHGAGFDVQHQSSSCEQELTALSAISQNATAKSLVLIDEIGFGMAAQYAEAVGVAQMLYLVEKVGSHVVFASHLTAVIQRLQTRLGSKCQTKQLEYHCYTQAGEDKATSEVAQEGVTFHYVITDGIASDSFALDTARRAGIPPQILERARGLRDDL
ncbi:hypothetical protein BBJ28_00001607, partial [Nothophytophthora sp. Chile5]